MNKILKKGLIIMMLLYAYMIVGGIFFPYTLSTDKVPLIILISVNTILISCLITATYYGVKLFREAK